MVGVRHPSLWIFIRKMKDGERANRLQKRQLERGQLMPQRRRKWINLQTRIDRVRGQYERGERNADELWNALTYVIQDYQ